MEAFERNVRSTKYQRATCYFKKRPTSREPDLQQAGGKNGDKKQKPGPTGISVRWGSEDCTAQPEAEEPGELQRGKIPICREDEWNTLPKEIQVRVQEVSLRFQSQVPLQRLVPLLQQVQE